MSWDDSDWEASDGDGVAEKSTLDGGNDIKRFAELSPTPAAHSACASQCKLASVMQVTVAAESSDPVVFVQPSEAQDLTQSDVCIAMHTKGPPQNVGVWLHEVKWFMNNTGRDFWWLLQMAQAGNRHPLTGKERAPRMEAGFAALLDNMQRRIVFSTQRFRCFAGLAQGTESEQLLLQMLPALQFQSGGRIAVFRTSSQWKPPQVPDWRSVYEDFAKYLSVMEPQWMIGGTCTLNVVIVGVYVRCSDCCDGQGKRCASVWAVWNKTKRNVHRPKAWAFPGGKVDRQRDSRMLDTAQREWDEEVLVEGFRWDNAIVQGRELFVSRKPGGLSSAFVYVIVHVTKNFYERTCGGKHGDAYLYDREALEAHKEHEEGCWLDLDMATGALSVRDGVRPRTQIIEDNRNFFASKPRPVWEFLLIGSDGAVRTEELTLGPTGVADDWEELNAD